ncbi:hotdog family protein [Polaromonas sp. A23]|uniref:hotdog family protein n=1 Tax=Polaromonas sp. A23 TaxID=1944133 RepID=UPI0009862571|nr:3-hydroxylacyl-ACP dehydratase [Polaromonas sp. A23]
MLTPPHLPSTLQHDDIARRIPHQGSMCLLDSVSTWDAQHIVCQASSHRAPDHPLRAHGRLGAACGVEYAAQAMAVHGTLVAQALAGESAEHTPPRAGYLASVRSVTLSVERLDTIAGPLTIRADRLTGDDNTILYSFSLQAGDQNLLAGRAVVVLDASALARSPSTQQAAGTSP